MQRAPSDPSFLSVWAACAGGSDGRMWETADGCEDLKSPARGHELYLASVRMLATSS